MNVRTLRLHALTSLVSLVGIAATACSAPVAPAEAPPSSPPAAAPAPEAKAPEKAQPRVVPIERVTAQGSFLPPLPTAVTSFGAAGSGKQLFIAGGYAGIPHAYSTEGQSADVLAYEVGSAEGFQVIAQLDQGLQGLAAVVQDGKLCTFGGNHASNAAGTPTVMNSVTSARCLDTQTKAWTDLPALPLGRSSHAAVLAGSTVYVTGGWTLNGNADSGVFVEDVLALDLKKPEAGWKSIPAPFKRRAVGAGVVGNKLVIVGGMTSDGKPSNEVDVYDTKTGAWSKGAAFPGDAFGIGVASVNQAIFASGRDGVLKSFKPGDAAWKDVRKLAYGRFFHQLVPVGNELVVLGGIGGMHTRGRTRAIEKVPTTSGLSFGQMTFAYPGVAKNRQGIVAHGEEFYYFGGNDSLEQHDFERKNFTSEGWVFDLATLQFRETTPYPFRRQSMQTLETDAGGIAIGGFGHEPLVGDDTLAVSHPEAFSYDWDKSEWKALASLPRGRTQFGVAAHGDALWIFGGLNYDPNRKGPAAFDHDRSIWRASKTDPTRRFEVVEGLELPAARRAFAGAVFGDKYVIVGGMKDGFQLVEDCLEFDFEKRTFAPFPCPASRLSGDLIAAGGKLYLVGGSVKAGEDVKETRRIDVYDPKTKKWSDLGFELPFSTRHLRALPYRDQILLLTTHSTEKDMTVAILNPGL